MRLPKFAETTFERAGSYADALAHPPEEDQNGWDYMVEFAPRKHEGPADLHPPGRRAFVQIKSSRSGRLNCRVKLSNALKAAQSRDPWFVVLMIASEGKAEPEIYAIHVWRELIAKTLREVRAAEKDGIELNRKTMGINFETTDQRTERNLVHWMESCIDAVGTDYSTLKKAIHESVGFEAGHGVVNFSIAGHSEEIYDNFLGVGSGLPVDNFSFTPTRFGIAHTHGAAANQRGMIHITPNAVGDCEVRLRGPQSKKPISLPAKIYALGEPILPRQQSRIRVSARGLELMWSVEGPSKLSLRIERDRVQPLQDVENIATLMHWAEQGLVEVQIWTEKGRILAGTLNVPPAAEPTFQWVKLIDVIDTLRTLAGHSASEFSLAAIDDAAKDLYFLHQVVVAPSLMMEGPLPLELTPSDSCEVFYYVFAIVGEHAVFAIIERPLRKLEHIDQDKKRLILGSPQLRESWVAPVAKDRLQQMIENDYQRILGAVGDGNTLSLGDIRDIYEQGRQRAS